MPFDFDERPRNSADLEALIRRTQSHLDGLRAERDRALRPEAHPRPAHADQQRVIDASFAQRVANDESEPGRDYAE